MNDEKTETTLQTAQRTLGYFVTRVAGLTESGERIVWQSRSHRKGLGPIRTGQKGGQTPIVQVRHPWIALWAPWQLAWWIALLFIFGSTCFAMGSFASNWPGHIPESLTGIEGINTIFFIGSIFFTTAAFMQLQEAINGDVADVGVVSKAHRWRWFAWKPRNAGFSASLIQFVGTVLFNFNTGDAMRSGLTWEQEDVLIWTPNILGSICFLVASYVALIEVSHSLWSFKPRQVSWWIAVINLWGSIAFMLAAGFGFYGPGSGSAVWSWGANTFTLVGAMCFLVAAYLMIPELFGAARETEM